MSSPQVSFGVGINCATCCGPPCTAGPDIVQMFKLGYSGLASSGLYKQGFQNYNSSGKAYLQVIVGDITSFTVPNDGLFQGEACYWTPGANDISVENSIVAGPGTPVPLTTAGLFIISLSAPLLSDLLVVLTGKPNTPVTCTLCPIPQPYLFRTLVVNSNPAEDVTGLMNNFAWDTAQVIPWIGNKITTNGIADSGYTLPSLIPNGTRYDSSGHFTLSGLTPGRYYAWMAQAADPFYITTIQIERNSHPSPSITFGYFYATTSSILVTGGTPNAYVSATCQGPVDITGVPWGCGANAVIQSIYAPFGNHQFIYVFSVNEPGPVLSLGIDAESGYTSSGATSQVCLAQGTNFCFYLRGTAQVGPGPIPSGATYDAFGNYLLSTTPDVWYSWIQETYDYTAPGITGGSGEFKATGITALLTGQAGQPVTAIVAYEGTDYACSGIITQADDPIYTGCPYVLRFGAPESFLSLGPGGFNGHLGNDNPISWSTPLNPFCATSPSCGSNPP